jgi:hypothetical protein
MASGIRPNPEPTRNPEAPAPQGLCHLLHVRPRHPPNPAPSRPQRPPIAIPAPCGARGRDGDGRAQGEVPAGQGGRAGAAEIGSGQLVGRATPSAGQSQSRCAGNPIEVADPGAVTQRGRAREDVPVRGGCATFSGDALRGPGNDRRGRGATLPPPTPENLPTGQPGPLEAIPGGADGGRSPGTTTFGPSLARGSWPGPTLARRSGPKVSDSWDHRSIESSHRCTTKS